MTIEEVDLTNYMAIAVLEQMGITQPTQAQINIMESHLHNIVMVKKLTLDSKLSPLESICLYSIAKGNTVNEIAILMKIEVSIVEEHIRSIMRKLNARTISQAVFEGIRFGYLPENVGVEKN